MGIGPSVGFTTDGIRALELQVQARAEAVRAGMKDFARELGQYDLNAQIENMDKMTPNATSTAKRKGFNRPIHHTGGSKEKGRVRVRYKRSQDWFFYDVLWIGSMKSQKQATVGGSSLSAAKIATKGGGVRYKKLKRFGFSRRIKRQKTMEILKAGVKDRGIPARPFDNIDHGAFERKKEELIELHVRRPQRALEAARALRLIIAIIREVRDFARAGSGQVAA